MVSALVGMVLIAREKTCPIKDFTERDDFRCGLHTTLSSFRPRRPNAFLQAGARKRNKKINESGNVENVCEGRTALSGNMEYTAGVREFPGITCQVHAASSVIIGLD